MSEQEEHEAVAPEDKTENARDNADTQEAPNPEIIERAKLLGWKSPDDWKGDPPPRGFMTAEDWVEKFANTPQEIEALKAERERERREFDARIKRMEVMNEAALDRQRQQLQARMDGAVEMGDTDAYKAAKAEMQALDKQERAEPEQAGPPPETQAWMARNPWFGNDAVMTAAARAVADEAVRKGITDVSAQLAYVDREIAQRFNAPKRKTAAVEDGGMIAPRKRTRGVSELPPEARKAGEKFVKQGLYKSLDEYAADYHKLG